MLTYSIFTVMLFLLTIFSMSYRSRLFGRIGRTADVGILISSLCKYFPFLSFYHSEHLPLSCLQRGKPKTSWLLPRIITKTGSLKGLCILSQEKYRLFTFVFVLFLSVLLVLNFSSSVDLPLRCFPVWEPIDWSTWQFTKSVWFLTSCSNADQFKEVNPSIICSLLGLLPAAAKAAGFICP